MSRKIKDISLEELKEIISKSTNITNALNNCDLYYSKGRARTTLKNRCYKEGLAKDFEKLEARGLDPLLNQKQRTTKITKEMMFVENCKTSMSIVRNFIRKNKILENKCYECNLEPFWNNKFLVLQIDHINGINNDNRLENLRYLCPNCHSQTDTFTSKGLKLPPKICLNCDKHITRQAKRCRSCAFKIRKNKGNPKTKIIWPSDEELQQLIWLIPRTQLKNQLGVSDVAISRYCKRRNIEQPPRGYWTKCT